jgi:hypothetical protein
MSKYFAVFVFSLLVLTGAMGLRTLAVVHSKAALDSSFSMQGRPFPHCPPSCGE